MGKKIKNSKDKKPTKRHSSSSKSNTVYKLKIIKFNNGSWSSDSNSKSRSRSPKKWKKNIIQSVVIFFSIINIVRYKTFHKSLCKTRSSLVA